MMNFEWDEKKNTINIYKHKIDFNDVTVVFERSILIDYDDSNNYGEDRWIGIGLLMDIVVTIIFTESNKDTIRVISARKADKNERKRYY